MMLHIKIAVAYVTIILCFSLLLIYLKNREAKGFLHASLFFLCSSIFLLGKYHLGFGLTPGKVIFWSKFYNAGVIGYLYAVPMFISSIAGKRLNLKVERGLGAIAVISMALTIFTNLVIRNSTRPKFGMLEAEPGVLFPFFIALLLIIGLCSLFYLRAASKEDGSKPIKLAPIAIGFTFCIFTAIIDIMGILHNKPVISGIGDPSIFGIFIISLLFNWAFMSQYSIVLGTLKKTESKVEQLLKKSEKNLIEFVQLIAKTIDTKDHYTAGHSIRVRDYALKIAKALNLIGDDVELLKQACLLHDIGKIGIPDGILNKKSPLNANDREHILKHPVLGKQILSTVDEFQRILDVIYSHHERIDGKGYPNGKTHDDIPLLARILAVADAYDAMRSERPYRKANTQEQALEELKKCSGTQFDPRIVDIFSSILEEIA